MKVTISDVAKLAGVSTATVTHINRMPMTAHYLPFTSENGALAQLKMDDARS